MAPFVLLGAFLVLAATGPAPAHSTAAQSLPSTRPFQGLFAPVGAGPGVAPPLERSMGNLVFQTPGSMSSRGPEVVCGTTVFRGDPDIDPGIVRRSPDQRTRFTVRRIPAPGCGR